MRTQWYYFFLIFRQPTLYDRYSNSKTYDFHDTEMSNHDWTSILTNVKPNKIKNTRHRSYAASKLISLSYFVRFFQLTNLSVEIDGLQAAIKKFQVNTDELSYLDEPRWYLRLSQGKIACVHMLARQFWHYFRLSITICHT